MEDDGGTSFQSRYMKLTQNISTPTLALDSFNNFTRLLFELVKKSDDEKKKIVQFMKSNPAVCAISTLVLNEADKKALQGGIDLLNWRIQDCISTVEHQMRQANGGRTRRRSTKSRSKSRRRK